jgi:hypothetical protein
MPRQVFTCVPQRVRGVQPSLPRAKNPHEFLQMFPLASIVAKLGGTYKDNKERPVYCCLQDRKNPDIYWAIPTGDVLHRTSEQLERIRKYCEQPERDIRSCFYHIGHTNRPAIFKISNVLPVTENHLDGEYISKGKHLMLKNKTQIDAITRKLSRILFDESVIRTNMNSISLRFITILWRRCDGIRYLELRCQGYF